MATKYENHKVTMATKTKPCMVDETAGWSQYMMRAKQRKGWLFLSAFLIVVDVLLHVLYEIVGLGAEVQTRGLHHLNNELGGFFLRRKRSKSCPGKGGNKINLCTYNCFCMFVVKFSRDSIPHLNSSMVFPRKQGRPESSMSMTIATTSSW